MGTISVCKECDTPEQNKNTNFPNYQGARQPITLKENNLSPVVANKISKSGIDFLQGNKVKIVYEKGEVYEGEVKERLKHGFGKMTWPSGSYYEGHWQYDHPMGEGRYFDGNTYQGIFKNQSIAEGRFLSQNGEEIYNGQFKDNKFNGFGRLQKKNKFVYEGYFLNNLKSGKGKIVLADQTTYEGEFMNGKFEGYGTYQSKTHTYTGYFKNGVPNGRGKYSWANGNYYEGNYTNGQKSGYGVYVTTDGARYQGQWSQGKRHGKGLQVSPEGQSQKVYFVNGEKQLGGEGIFTQ